MLVPPAAMVAYLLLSLLAHSRAAQANSTPTPSMPTPRVPEPYWPTDKLPIALHAANETGMYSVAAIQQLAK